MRYVHPALARLHAACRRVGPYVLLEMLLPGGTLMALLLYLFQRARATGGLGEVRPVAPAHRVAMACCPWRAVRPALASWLARSRARAGEAAC
jgi:hypothetical protein